MRGPGENRKESVPTVSARANSDTVNGLKIREAHVLGLRETSKGVTQDGLEELGGSCFLRTGIQSIEIPRSVQSIKIATFDSCH